MHIPQLPADVDAMTAALAYAAAGWYVLPVRRGTKHPGSVVGERWQAKSSRDPQQIAAWFAGTDNGIALHCGRSGAVLLDVDNPDKLPEVLSKHLDTAPYQSTRLDTRGRGHYPFAMPPGRTFGNGTGRLGGAWGEVRGLNGVIIVEPSHHPEGGEYRWQRGGPLSVLPDEIAAQLDDASPATDAANDAAVAAFLAEHVGNARPELLRALVTAMTTKISVGESRHMSCVSALTGAMKEARAGYYPASAAREAIGAAFIAAVSRDPVSDKQGPPRIGRVAVDEFDGIEAWSVGQALGVDLDEVHARLREKMPDNRAWTGDVPNAGIGTLTAFPTEPAEPAEVPEPAGPPEDGAALLDDVYAFLGRFVSYPSEHARVAHTLWIGHAWLMECWESTPRIAFLSPEPGSGKTRALEITEPLVPFPIHSVNVTSAYLFRKIAEVRPTLLYDEIDTVFGPKARDNEEIRGVLNSGHRNGATAGRCVVRGKLIETEDLPSYCAVAMAGLNDLPDTIMDRSVIVRMRRRAPDEKVEPWRARINGPQAAPLAERLSRWTCGVRSAATAHWPDMPDGITDRNADIWEALLTVADQAGGHWPQTARRSAVALVADAKGGQPSTGVQLLCDIKTAFELRGRDSLSTAELLTDLRGMVESPWQTIGRDGKGLDTRGLATRLSRYQVKSKNIRVMGQVLKGYERFQFVDAWLRYPAPIDDESASRPPGESATSATSATPQVNGTMGTADVATVAASCDTCGKELTQPDSVDRGRCAECHHCEPVGAAGTQQ